MIGNLTLDQKTENCTFIKRTFLFKQAIREYLRCLPYRKSVFNCRVEGDTTGDIHYIENSEIQELSIETAGHGPVLPSAFFKNRIYYF